jgi:hypothetical protein
MKEKPRGIVGSMLNSSSKDYMISDPIHRGPIMSVNAVNKSLEGDLHAQASVPRAERPAASAKGREYSQAERVSTRNSWIDGHQRGALALKRRWNRCAV